MYIKDDKLLQYLGILTFFSVSIFARLYVFFCLSPVYMANDRTDVHNNTYVYLKHDVGRSELNSNIALR